MMSAVLNIILELGELGKEKDINNILIGKEISKATSV